VHHPRNRLALLIADANRHFNVFIGRFKSSTEFARWKRQVKIVTDING
jgi:hypothetical protein